MGTLGFYVVSFRDYDNEAASCRFHCVALNAGNFAAQDTLRGDLFSAINAITLGNPEKSEFGNLYKMTAAPATAPAAQRELKWLVHYHDTTALERYSVTLPTADTQFMDPNDRPNAHIGDGAQVDAFVSAFEAFVRSDKGNAVVVDEISLVGRRV